MDSIRNYLRNPMSILRQSRSVLRQNTAEAVIRMCVIQDDI